MKRECRSVLRALLGDVRGGRAQVRVLKWPPGFSGCFPSGAQSIRTVSGSCRVNCAKLVFDTECRADVCCMNDLFKE